MQISFCGPFCARYRALAAALLLLSLLPAAGTAQGSADSDLAAARALFEKNIQAIRNKDRDAYLACYLRSEQLVRTGPGGFELGYAGLAATAGQGWPDHIAAEDLRLTPVRPGVVYGTYRYRVRYGPREVAGLSERLFLETPEGWRIAVSTAFAAEPGVPPPPRALVGATLLDGTGGPPVRDAVVLMREGRIECAGPRAACPVPAGVDSVDLAGHWITPGLVDAHVHFSQTGWADGRPDALDVRATHPYEKTVAELRRHPERLGRSLLCSGVTAAFDVGGYPWTLELAARFEANPEVPRVAAAGPLLSTRDHWVNLPAERQFLHIPDAAAARSGAGYLAEQGAGAVKVWFITPGARDPEREKKLAAMAAAVRAAGEEAARRKLPLIVHATGLAEAKVALAAGAKLLVHSVSDLPVDAEFLDLARRNGAVYCPTLTVMGGYARLMESAFRRRNPPVDDPNGCVGPEVLARVERTREAPAADVDEALIAAMAKINAEQDRISADNLKRVAEAGIAIAMGTDAGNPLTLHGPSVYAEMEAMQAAGLAPLRVLTAATLGGAAAMGRDKDLGTVEKGKLADLLVVAADPAADVANLRQMRFVVRGGVVRPLAELSALARTREETPQE